MISYEDFIELAKQYYDTGGKNYVSYTITDFNTLTQERGDMNVSKAKRLFRESINRQM